MDVSGRCATAVALLATLSLGLVGCAGEEATSPPKRSNAGPAPASSGPGPRAVGVDAAVAAYRAMWQDLEAAGLTADPDSPRLGDHATGAALRLLKYGLSKDRQDGVIAKGAVILSPLVESAAPANMPTRVTIEDCTDSSHWLVYKPDGTLKNDVPGGHHDTKATVQRFGSEWSVVDLTMGEAGSC
jgi:hypothetical protein